jgi:flagellar biosynthesis protein
MSDPDCRPTPKRAIALSYDPDVHAAPVVAAVGQGLIAEEIIRRAREAGVPVNQNDELAAALSRLDVGDLIPPEVYLVVAEILAHVYRLEHRLGESR